MTTVVFGAKIEDELCLALGFFDGVHLGHRKIFEVVDECALQSGCKKAVQTFSDSPKKSDTILTYLDRKRLFDALGMDYCLSLSFSRECGKTGRAFFAELIASYRIKELVCGEDYLFGSDHCDVRALEELCSEKGLPLHVVKLFDLDGVRVSSTAVKTLIKSGKLRAVNKMLVTPYHITGFVVAGQGIGRNIGMPTVNIEIPIGVLPLKNGVYGTRVKLGMKMYDAVTNYGNKPTFDSNKLAIESHLFSYSGGSLLGEEITVYFMKFIRHTRKFKTAEELVAQIEIDKHWTEKC